MAETPTTARPERSPHQTKKVFIIHPFNQRLSTKPSWFLQSSKFQTRKESAVQTVLFLAPNQTIYFIWILEFVCFLDNRKDFIKLLAETPTIARPERSPHQTKKVLFKPTFYQRLSTKPSWFLQSFEFQTRNGSTV